MAREFRLMKQEPAKMPTLPDWVQSLGDRLRHDLNGEMTVMPEKVMTTLMRLFQREHYAARRDAADRNKRSKGSSPD